MKEISNWGLSFLLMILCSTIVSCSEEYTSPLKDLVINDITYDSGSHWDTINLNVDISNCIAKYDVRWFDISLLGSGMAIVIDNNDTYDERKAVVTIIDPEDDTTITFQIIQKQKDGIIANETSYDVPEEGGIVIVKVQSNVDYEVGLPSEGWISLASETRALSNSDFKLKVAKNNSGSKREGTVYIYNKKSNTYATVLIKQTLTPYIKIEGGDINVDGEGGDVAVKVKTNIDVDSYSTIGDWITLKNKTITNDHDFTLEINVYPYKVKKGTRYGYITLKSFKHNYSYTFKIIQTVKPQQITNITDLILSYTHVESYTSGYFGNVLAYAYIKNNSPYTIYLTSLKMKNYSYTLINESYEELELLSGASKTVYYDTYFSELSKNGYSCTWTFIYDNEEYTINGSER